MCRYRVLHFNGELLVDGWEFETRPEAEEFIQEQIKGFSWEYDVLLDQWYLGNFKIKIEER